MYNAHMSLNCMEKRKDQNIFFFFFKLSSCDQIYCQLESEEYINLQWINK